jgi:hypothetical protein
MPSIREQLIKRFRLPGQMPTGMDELSSALYALLYSIGAGGLVVDDWETFYVRSESETSLAAVGLMTLLPEGSVPIEVRIESLDQGFSWTVQTVEWDSWRRLTEARRWKDVYLYGTNSQLEPSWEWSGSYSGRAFPADA